MAGRTPKNILKPPPKTVPSIVKDIKIFITPLAVLCNTTIGIGIFALPYMASRVGLPAILAYFAVLGSLVTIIQVMFAQVSLKTPDYRRMPGFVLYYLGPQWCKFEKIISVVGFAFTMVAFMSVGGQFLHQLLSPILNGPEALYYLAYFLIGSFLIYFGIDLISRVGAFGLIIFFAILAIIGIKGAPLFETTNLLTKTGSIGDIFLPYGTVLFALWASSSIPEIEEMLGRDKRKDLLIPVIIACTAIAIAIYLFFIFLVLGITGAATAQSALIGLKKIFPPELNALLFAFGLVTTFTSFIIMGLTFKKILTYDFKLNKKIAWLITTLVPLAIFYSGLNSFIMIFSLMGGILLGIDGIIIILMYQKTYPQKKRLTYPLISIFTIGIFCELFYFLK